MVIFRSLRYIKVKAKVIPQQVEVAQGVLIRLRPRIFLTFGTTRVVGRQPYAPAAFTPEEIPGTHFQRLSRPQGTWFRLGEPRKKTPVTPPGIDPGTVRLVRYPRPPLRYIKTTITFATSLMGGQLYVLQNECNRLNLIKR